MSITFGFRQVFQYLIRYHIDSCKKQLCCLSMSHVDSLHIFALRNAMFKVSAKNVNQLNITASVNN